MQPLNTPEDLETIEFLQKAVERIDSANIEKEMTIVASQLAFANAKEADALQTELFSKLHLEQVEARLYLTVIAMAETKEGKKKPTEANINAMVKSNPEWGEAMRDRAIAAAKKKRLQGYAFALAAKRDMLTSIGMRINTELRADPLAAAQSRGERLAREQ